MNKGTLDNHLEMLMPVEMQHDIGCDAEEPYQHRDVSQRVMRIINRCVEQAEQIRILKRHRHLVNEECQGYVVLNDGLNAENQRLKEALERISTTSCVEAARFDAKQALAAQPQGDSDE